MCKFQRLVYVAVCVLGVGGGGLVKGGSLIAGGLTRENMVCPAAHTDGLLVCHVSVNIIYAWLLLHNCDIDIKSNYIYDTKV